MPTAALTDIDQSAAAGSSGRARLDDIVGLAPEQSFGAALREYGSKVNPVAMVQGLIQTVAHPGEFLKNWGAQQEQLADAAEEAYKRGDYGGAAAHGLNYVLNAVPGLGTSVDEAATKLANGDIAGGIADTAAIATLLGVGKKVPAAAKGAASLARDAATAVPAAVKAAAPDLARGGVQVASGELLAKVPGMEWPARLALQYPGVKQMARGIRTGIKAGAESLKPDVEVPAAAGAPDATAPGAAPTEVPTPAPVAAPEPPIEIPKLNDGTTLEELRKSLPGMDLGQVTDIFNRLRVAETPPPAASTPAPPAAAAPTAPAPAAAAPSPAAAPVAVPAATAPPNPQALAQQLFEEAQRNGTVPAGAKPGEPFGGAEADAEDFADKARTARQSNAEFVADHFDEMAKMKPDELTAFAKAHGQEFPASAKAQSKLIQEAIRLLQLKPGKTTSIGQLMANGGRQ